MREGSRVPEGRKDFFVSHAGSDRAWAEWVAYQLAEAGYTVELDVWAWAAGQDFITKISDALDQCDRVLALWSAEYFNPARYTRREWTAALAEPPGAAEGRLVPVRVEDVSAAQVPTILRPLVYRDLFGLPEKRGPPGAAGSGSRPGPARPGTGLPGPGHAGPAEQPGRDEPAAARDLAASVEPASS